MRHKAPLISTEITPGYVKPEVIRLKNSVPVYMLLAGSQPVIRMDITFRAGSWWQTKPLVASSVITMLAEGTSRKSSKQIAEHLDYHGAYLNSSADRDNACLTVYFLEKHTDSILPLVAEVIRDPSFPEEEFNTYRDRRKQSFLIENSKVSNLTREMFALAIYGSKHPYGQTFSIPDFDNITSEDLSEFHAGHYHSGNCSIIISGRFNMTLLAARLDELFGSEWNSSGSEGIEKKEKQPSSERQIFIPKKDAVQCSLRIGRETFNRSHPEYAGLLILNNLLGGHFGSRLMQNIREKKGYTYGIGSALITLRNSGYIVIVSEVGASYWKASVKEIYRELDKLCSRPVTKKELELNKSQMLGEILRDFDGPFARAETIRNLVEDDLVLDFYERIISAIRNTGPSELIDLAALYLDPGSMYEVVAGNGNQKPGSMQKKAGSDRNGP
jgi:zinc protease